MPVLPLVTPGGPQAAEPLLLPGPLPAGISVLLLPQELCAGSRAQLCSWAAPGKQL